MVPKTTRIRIAFMGLYKRTFFIAASVGEFDTNLSWFSDVEANL